ncbi:unnamed protein product [Timema podura]|uniref:TELO2-interacting protein 2 n=1 Tax=Timema podura TaxID=61482 RepID=A0ABN7NFT0_TIMPD|nr:unnamed protein product [Timema podura]
MEDLLKAVETLHTNSEVSESVCKATKEVITKTYVPQMKVGYERPLEESDFKNFIPVFEKNLKVLCGEHKSEAQWTSTVTRKLSDELLNSLCEICKCTSSVELLVGQESNINAKVPYLSEHLSSVLPTALITVDDFNTETQVFGISCLEHIIEHVTRTELNWYGQGDVIYKALERLLYHREAELIRPLLRCVVLLLGKLEGGYTSHDNNYKWSRYDDVLQIVLQNTEHEQNIPLRRAYMDSLPTLLDASKMGVIRWSKRLLRILREYLEVAGYSEHDSAIPILQV